MSQGTGDIYIQASCTGIISIQTYITTLFYCNAELSTDDGNWLDKSTTGSSLTFGTNGLTYSANNATDEHCYFNHELPTNCEIELTITAFTYAYTSTIRVNNVGVEWSNGTRFFVKTNGYDQSRVNLNVGDVLKFVLNNNSVSVYQNDSLIGTATGDNSQELWLNTWTSRSISFNNIKIKEL